MNLRLPCRATVLALLLGVSSLAIIPAATVAADPYDASSMLNLAALTPASVSWIPGDQATPVPAVTVAPIDGGLVLPETDTEPAAAEATSPILPLFLLLFALSPIVLFDLTRKPRAR